MERVYGEYELVKERRNEIDFEDVLENAITLLTSDADDPRRLPVSAFARSPSMRYQDVNLLQQALLDLWLGERDDLCVVGDDFQSIYSFTGASPRWLLGAASRFPDTVVVRLEDNYRSSPQVLALANRLVPRLGGSEKLLRATCAAGDEPLARSFPTSEAEGAWVAETVKRLAREGVSMDEVAVLCRTNARLADFEELFHDAGVPFQGSSLLAREGGEAAARSAGAGVPRRASRSGSRPSLPRRACWRRFPTSSA